MNLTGKIAVVFGGNGDVGSNLIKKLFLNKIDSVYTSFHTNFNNILELKKIYGDKLSFNQVDIRDPVAIQKFIENIQQVDIGINCVGIVDDHSVSKLSFESWNRVIETNLTGTFNTSKYLFEKMKSVKQGRIINISSIVAFQGAFGQSNYAASKSGILGLTKTLAIEGAKYNILVNCVVPGYITSKMIENIPKPVLNNIIQKIPLKKLGVLDDISNAILFLSSDYSNYITGQTINVSGGL
ncbi:dehydrogenase [Candidatus Nitrosarchaeum limnium SFB1]|uniref:Dehydrogenase n=1 Tax=Candidatus Nitrosarchaeum limnium SFB1 TaxID=886738 RepID=F3KMW9_9ARCH|nr:dehydrogenase [Candidatus Nitrosarchaeum limnium SFB1]